LLNVQRTGSPERKELLDLARQTGVFKPHELAVLEEVLDEYLRRQDASGYRCYTARLGNEVAGFVCYGHNPVTEGTWDIYWIAVAPSCQRRGVGTALLRVAEEDIASRQGRLIVIETSSTPLYEPTRRFYEGQGYQLLAQIADFYAPGDGLMLYGKRIA